MALTFNNICDLLENIEKVPTQQPPEARTERIQNIIVKWFSKHRAAVDDPNADGGAILSILFPHKRKDRVYGLQAASLMKKIKRLTNMVNEQQIQKLFEYHDRGRGDPGLCVERAWKRFNPSLARKQHTSIAQLDELLTQMAARSRWSSQVIRAKLNKDFNTDSAFKSVLFRQNSMETKWLVRLILNEYGTVKWDDGFVLSQFHWLLPNLLSFQNDFDAAIGLLKGPLRNIPADVASGVRSRIRGSAAAQLVPTVGIKIGRPQFIKARSLKNCFDMLRKRAWAADIKYDGEYCEIHIDLTKGDDWIRIFSKNGKDATQDRKALHSTIRDALRIGTPECYFKEKCIVLGEMVVYSDKEDEIAGFHKIRKHVRRSGSFLGIEQDSQRHYYEHLMVVFFDVLLLDDFPTMCLDLQKRRDELRHLVQPKPGYAMRSRWYLIDSKNDNGISDLKEAFADTIQYREEGLVLKPLHAPYLPLFAPHRTREPQYLIKMKEDYLEDMGGQRDLGDFAVIGASYKAQLAVKSDMPRLRWTHFHIGCLTNKAAALAGVKPSYKVVALLSCEHSIPKVDLKWMHDHGPFRAVDLENSAGMVPFDFTPCRSLDARAAPMEVAFKDPFIVEVLGSRFEKVQNETFFMLRHPRVRKIHSDRDWKDAVCIDELEKMAYETWTPPGSEELGGHAKDVALLVAKRLGEQQSQAMTQSTNDTQNTTSTQGVGVKASRKLEFEEENREAVAISPPKKKQKREPLALLDEVIVLKPQ